jgi:hypothetical protein
MTRQTHLTDTARPDHVFTFPMVGGTPLDKVAGGCVDFENLSETQLRRLRAYAARRSPLRAFSELDYFLGSFFAEQEVIVAYFRPTRVPSAFGDRRLVQVLPIDYAAAAADRALRMEFLLPHERALAWAAALVYPCALFHAADPNMQVRRGMVADRVALRSWRNRLTSDAMRELRLRNRALAETFAAALDLTTADDCDPEQLARICSSVRLASLQLEALWGGGGQG